MHKQYAIPSSGVFLSLMKSQNCLHRLNSRRTRKPEGAEKVNNSPRRPRDRSHRGGMVGWPSVSYVLELEKLTHAFQPHPLTKIFHHISTILFITILILY